MARLPYPQAARSLLRDTIVSAVDELVRQQGWSTTTMSDVARAAGVSRQTVYNEFGTRQELVQAYILREIEALISEVETHVRAHADDARAALSGAFALFLKLASDEPLVRVIAADAEGGELMHLLTTTGLAVAAERVGALIEQVWPQVARDDARLIAGSLARLAISHALVPTTGARMALVPDHQIPTLADVAPLRTLRPEVPSGAVGVDPWPSALHGPQPGGRRSHGSTSSVPSPDSGISITLPLPVSITNVPSRPRAWIHRAMVEIWGSPRRMPSRAATQDCRTPSPSARSIWVIPLASRMFFRVWAIQRAARIRRPLIAPGLPRK